MFALISYLIFFMMILIVFWVYKKNDKRNKAIVAEYKNSAKEIIPNQKMIQDLFDPKYGFDKFKDLTNTSEIIGFIELVPYISDSDAQKNKMKKVGWFLAGAAVGVGVKTVYNPHPNYMILLKDKIIYVNYKEFAEIQSKYEIPLQNFKINEYRKATPAEYKNYPYISKHSTYYNMTVTINQESLNLLVYAFPIHTPENKLSLLGENAMMAHQSFCDKFNIKNSD